MNVTEAVFMQARILVNIKHDDYQCFDNFFKACR